MLNEDVPSGCSQTPALRLLISGPSSAFLAYSNSRRAELKRQNPKATNADLSRMLSKSWKALPPADRAGEFVNGMPMLSKAGCSPRQPADVSQHNLLLHKCIWPRNVSFVKNIRMTCRNGE